MQDMQEQKRWVLVADAGRAVLFSGNASELTLKQEFDNPKGRTRSSDLASDSNGQMTGGGGQAGRGPGASPTTDPQRVEAERFARELASHLKVHVEHEREARLVLVAAPHFLGFLRAAITEQVRKHVELTIDKDLTPLGTHELATRLREELMKAN